MGNRNICLLIVVAIFLMPMVVAQPTYTQNEAVNISLPCTIDGEYCSVNATCSATIINPDGEELYNNQAMTQNDATFGLNLSSDDTSVNGEYQFNVACSDNGESNSKNLIFFVSPNGETATTSKGLMYLGLLFVFLIFFGICLYGGKESEGVVGRSAFFLTAYLFLIAITFISWNLALDYLTSSPFIASFFRIIFLFLLYALFPTILILTFYTMWMMKKIDVIQNMVDKGMPIDEAYERTVRGGMNSRKW